MTDNFSVATRPRREQIRRCEQTTPTHFGSRENRMEHGTRLPCLFTPSGYDEAAPFHLSERRKHAATHANTANRGGQSRRLDSITGPLKKVNGSFCHCSPAVSHAGVSAKGFSWKDVSRRTRNTRTARLKRTNTLKCSELLHVGLLCPPRLNSTNNQSEQTVNPFEKPKPEPFVAHGLWPEQANDLKSILANYPLDGSGRRVIPKKAAFKIMQKGFYLEATSDGALFTNWSRFEREIAIDDGLREPAIERAELKALVNGNQWEEIGRCFGFKPEWCDLGGIRMFNWQSCNAAFWQVFQPVAKGTLSVGRIHLKAMAENHKQRVPNAKQRISTGRMFKPQLKALHKKQFGECYYCWHPTTLENFSIDHVVAASRGGSNKLSNKVGACQECNTYKGNLDVAIFEASEYLRRKREQMELKP